MNDDLSKKTHAAFGQSRGDSVLVSFAILQVNYDDRDSSYIDNFVPFVAQCVKESDHDEVSTSEVQERLKARFGLTIPQHALALIIKKGARRGYYKLQNHALVRDNTALAAIDIEPSRQLALRSYQDLLNRFIEFVRVRFSRDLTEEVADSCLLQYIMDRSLPIVRTTLLGESFQPELGNPNGLDFLVAEFIIHLAESDVSGFEQLNLIVRGCMLATAVYLPDPNERSRKITDLDIYFDTPLLVNLLGLHGEARRQATVELIDLLHGLGISTRCFAHTFSETENLILSCAGELRSTQVSDGQRHNEIVTYALSMGIGRSELEMIAGSLENRLVELGITVRNAPDYSRSTSIDESKLESSLQTAVGYLNAGARTKDLESLTAIWRLRGGNAMRSFESARAIFVTSNHKVVSASMDFFHERPNGFDVPVCALEGQLATVAWLRKPTVAPDLPGKQIIADCYAALEPGDALWKRYVSVVDRLRRDGSVTEEEYATLRFTVEAKRALMAEVVGNDSELVIGSIPEILRRANELRSVEQTQALITAEQRTLAAEESARREADLRDREAQKYQNERFAKDEELRRRIGNLSYKWAHRIGRVIYLFVVVIVISYLFFGPAIRSSAHGLGAWAVWVAAVLFLGSAGLTLNHTLRGTSVGAFVDGLERRLELRIDRWLSKKFEA